MMLFSTSKDIVLNFVTGAASCSSALYVLSFLLLETKRLHVCTVYDKQEVPHWPTDRHHIVPHAGCLAAEFQHILKPHAATCCDVAGLTINQIGRSKSSLAR